MKPSLIPSLPSCTTFDALKRLEILSEWLYPQTLTFNRVTWEPTPTLKSKLIPWFFLAFLGVMVGTSFYFILLQQLLSHRKDPEISVTTHLLLLLLCTYYTFSSSCSFDSFFTADDLAFVIRSMWKIKGMQVHAYLCMYVLMYKLLNFSCGSLHLHNYNEDLFINIKSTFKIRSILIK